MIAARQENFAFEYMYSLLFTFTCCLVSYILKWNKNPVILLKSVVEIETGKD